MTGSEYGDATRALRLGPFVVIRSEAFDHMSRSIARYCSLRKHMRHDGSVKVALPRNEAEREAARMTKLRGKPYVAYGCGLCKGMFHIGHKREAKS